MKITMTIETDSALELQNTVLQLADFCSLAGSSDEKTIPIVGVKETSKMIAKRKSVEEQGNKAAQQLAPDVAEEQTVSIPVTSTEPVFTKEQVRDKMGELPTAKVRELLQEFGVKRLSDIDPSHYPALMAKAQ